MKDKELARNDFMAMVVKSWTWGKLTERERDSVMKSLSRVEPFGNYAQRFAMMNAVYMAYVDGLGAMDSGWRMEEV